MDHDPSTVPAVRELQPQGGPVPCIEVGCVLPGGHRAPHLSVWQERGGALVATTRGVDATVARRVTWPA